MGRHSDAQQIIIQAFTSLFGRAPTLNERIFAGSVALGESGYGLGKYKNLKTGEEKVLNNWGAVQCKKGPPCDAGCWEATDHHINPDGSETPFQWCYQDNSGMSRVDAAVKFLTTLYKNRPQLLKAANEYPTEAQIAELLSGTGLNKLVEIQPLYDGKGTTVPLHEHYHVAWFSRVQRDSKYFEMKLQAHVGAQIRYHTAIKTETGESIVEGVGHMPTPKAPEPPSQSREEWLSLLGQSLLDDAEHRLYASLPPKTISTLRRFQISNGLKADGILGPKTLAKLLT